MDLFTLIKQEGWNVKKHKNNHVVVTPYAEDIGPLPVKHPALLHLEIYKLHSSPDIKYEHLKKAHDILWPDTVWHSWTERRFRAHCESWNYITLAAGASASKSYDVAKIAILFWYAAPRERNVTVASVTLASLLGRVWGYLTAHIKTMAVPLPYKYYRSNPPRILFEEPTSSKNKIDDDTLHGIFAVTARLGDDDQAIATWIGKHPKDKILLVLDEGTDMPMSILNATPNLNSHPEKFQLICIGNSNSTMDLHGILSTPKAGWPSVSVELQQWDTTQINGTCLYFSPYESPAITESDPEKRKLLSKFLISKETLESKEKELGKDSEKFYRWVLGFWKSLDLEEVIVTEAFLKDKDFYSTEKPEWSGFYPIIRVAGLDPAFSTEGDKCLLRVAYVGHTMDNKVRIDLGNGTTTHEIKLKAIKGVSLEKQVAEETIRVLRHYNVPLDNLAIDVTGQGRAIGEVICLLNEKQGYPLGFGTPFKIYSMSHHNLYRRKKEPLDMIGINSFILWTDVRKYIANSSLTGLDPTTRNQLITRRIVKEHKKGKYFERLESKLEYKRRMSAMGNAHSPDEADAAALIVQLVKMKLGIEPGATWDRPTPKIDSKTEERMVLHVNSQTGSRTPVKIEADFSSGLESFVEYWRPF